jgi:Putative DNA-binding domain
MESQDIEYKESWRDEYIKWVCGFANAQGGKIFIGINDKGIVTGVADSKKLLEDIPNKIKDILGWGAPSHRLPCFRRINLSKAAPFSSCLVLPLR